MLRLEKATLGKFGAQDMMSLITSQGWEAILPDALHDNHLLSGDGWNDDDPEPSSAALPLTLLLLTKVGANPSGNGFEVSLETLQEALCLLNTAVDREIVNRMLQRQDATPIGTGLIQGLQMLVQHASDSADSDCHA
jgi:hypothetical protein